MQIINGAQTVGSLGTALGNNSEQLKKCAVFVRLIPLNLCPDNFGNRITIASNTQNKIEKRDFVSLDPIQHDLRIELNLLGVTYHYKRTEDLIIFDNKNCSLEEATVALACFHEDIGFSVLAKRELGKLWENISEEPYISLFNDTIKAHVVWNVIKTYRSTMKYLNDSKIEKFGREKSTYTYGNYFVLHILFQLVKIEKIMNPNSDLDIYLTGNDFTSSIAEIVQNCYWVSELNYPTSLIHQLYRNHTKCKHLKEKVLNSILIGNSFEKDEDLADQGR